MKILFTIGSAEIGGTEKQVLKLCALLSSDLEINLGFINARGPLLQSIDTEKMDWVDIKLTKKQNVFRNAMAFLRYIQFLKKQKFDVVHSFLPESIILSWSAIALSNCRALKIAGVRGSRLQRNWFLNYCYVFFLRKSDFVTCNSNYLRNVCIKDYGISPERIIVIPNGISIPELKENSRSKDCRGVVISNLHPYKGLLTLLDAIKLSKTLFTVDIVGEGSIRKEIEAKISNLGLAKRVKLLGSQEISEKLFSYDFAIHPSETEGFSNAILEELSYGLPVICFDVGGNAEIITDQENGFLVKDFSPEALATKIDKIVGDSKIMAELTNNAQCSVTKYSWENIRNLYLFFYLNVTSKT